MKKTIGLLFIISLVCGLALTAHAAQLHWQGYIPGDGRQVGPINLQAGAKYYIQVEGSLIFGRSIMGGILRNDSCYSFGEPGAQRPMTILQNNLGINYCPGTYNPGHVYRSAHFISNGQPIFFRIVDTDYRDNQGGLQVKIFRVSSPPPNPNWRCRRYADQAVDQNRRNLQWGCGFIGNRWSNNWNGHYNWCLGVSVAAANSESQARTNALNRCQGTTNRRCRRYADRAVNHNRRNLQWGCGFTGSRWSNNWNGHYNWCRGVSAAVANSEDRARVNALHSCQSGVSQRCRHYANRAVNQNRRNQQWGCGFTGRRWSNNWNGHYNWCRRVSAAVAHREDQARVNALHSCQGGVNQRCRRYADRAVNQNRTNLRRGCGFTGNRWSNNWNGHYNWCRRVSASTSRHEDQARVNALNRCQGSANQRCRRYADRAVNQNRRNLRWNCGFTGNRWQNNWNNHYNWCRGVSAAAANSEDRARVNALNSCRSGGGGNVVRFNNPRYNGLPWDWCLTWATNCGQPAADDFCRKKGYHHAVHWYKRDFNATWVVNSGRRCDGRCGGFLYVDCAR